MMYANASVEITMEEKHNDLTEIIVIHNQNLMEMILVIKDTFDASCQREKVSTVI